MMRCGIYLRCFPRSCDLMWCASTAASAAAESGYWCCDCIHGIKNEAYVQRSLSVDQLIMMNTSVSNMAFEGGMNCTP